MRSWQSRAGMSEPAQCDPSPAEAPIQGAPDRFTEGPMKLALSGRDKLICGLELASNNPILIRTGPSLTWQIENYRYDLFVNY